MKTLHSVLLASVALASTLAARAETAAQAWLETYYVNPRPAELAANVRALSREGFFEKPGHTSLGIGFLATVFAAHPDRVDRWLGDLAALPATHQRLLAAALWQAGDSRGAERLRLVDRNSAVREDVLRLADTPAQMISDTPVQSSSSMNLQWGAFLASGDERHIIRILDGLGSGNRGLDFAARASLAQHAAAHPRVLEICRSQLERQPEEVRSVLRAALKEAQAKPRI